MPRVVIASPVAKPPAITRAFLDGLAGLDPADCTLEWIFVDDNASAESSALLHAFLRERPGDVLLPPPAPNGQVTDGTEHRWSADLVDRVAAHKDRLLARALERNADAVLLVDADLVLHPLTLEVLHAADVDIVSEVFWTQFDGVRADRRLPNVWMMDDYTLFEHRGPPPAPEHVVTSTEAFLRRLALLGVHAVGGLGACTLVRRRVIEAGVRFTRLPNVSWLGEDRHFCLRAAALGFGLWADTHVPPLHLYRLADLDEVDAYVARGDAVAARWQLARAARRAAESACAHAGAAVLTDEMRRDLAARLGPGDEVGIRALGNLVGEFTGVGTSTRVEVELELSAVATTPPWHRRVTTEVIVPSVDPRPSSRTGQSRPPLGPEVVVRHRVPILLSMIVRNEADRHLREVLSLLAQVVDDALIVDDASTDHTPELCRDLLARVPHRVEPRQHSLFHREHELRALQWRLSLERKPAWILNLDADELFEERALELLPALVRSASTNLIGFRLFDMWDPVHYRSDALWTAHRRHWPMLARPRAVDSSAWRRSNQHCGRWPLALARQPMEAASLRIKHLGWMNPDDRVAKYERYITLDPDGRDGSFAQYSSILDPAPQLERWEQTEGPC